MGKEGRGRGTGHEAVMNCSEFISHQQFTVQTAWGGRPPPRAAKRDRGKEALTG